LAVADASHAAAAPVGGCRHGASAAAFFTSRLVTRAPNHELSEHAQGEKRSLDSVPVRARILVMSARDVLDVPAKESLPRAPETLGAIRTLVHPRE
jgi:hypothetical protein